MEVILGFLVVLGSFGLGRDRDGCEALIDSIEDGGPGRELTV